MSNWLLWHIDCVLAGILLGAERLPTREVVVWLCALATTGQAFVSLGAFN